MFQRDLSSSLRKSANNHDIFSVEYYGTSAQKGERTFSTILGTVELFRESKMISVKGSACRLCSPKRFYSCFNLRKNSSANKCLTW